MNFTGDYSILKLNVFAYVFSQNMVIIEAQNCEINKVDIYIYMIIIIRNIEMVGFSTLLIRLSET